MVFSHACRAVVGFRKFLIDKHHLKKQPQMFIDPALFSWFSHCSLFVSSCITSALAKKKKKSLRSCGCGCVVPGGTIMILISWFHHKLPVKPSNYTGNFMRTNIQHNMWVFLGSHKFKPGIVILSSKAHMQIHLVQWLTRCLFVWVRVGSGSCGWSRLT